MKPSDEKTNSQNETAIPASLPGGVAVPLEPIAPELIRSRLLNREVEDTRYVLLDQVAQGGMGSIYDVFDQDLRRKNVLKVIRSDIVADPQMCRLFVKEARITAKLEHPNIVPVHDLGLLSGKDLFFTMKKVQGESLADILTRVRRGDSAYVEKYSRYQLLTIFRKICDAVAFAHSLGIIHRDIKPDNVMVAEYGEVLLMDWGLAKVQDKDEPEAEAETEAAADRLLENDPLAATRTRYGVIKGTPAYMSPEQASGFVNDIDERSDIFLLGSTLYAIATLYPPYVADDLYEMLDRAAVCDFTPPAERAPEREIPDELCRIINKAMSLDPDERYQTATELATDIDALLSGQTRSEHRLFAAGDLLINEGDTGNEAYVIVSGEVEVFKTIQDQRLVLVRLGPGDVVGEMAMISTAPRSASVVALTDTETVVITQEVMTQGLRKLPPWMGRSVAALVDRLRAANAHMHPLMRGDCSYHVLRQFQLMYAFHGHPMEDELSGLSRIMIHLSEVITEISAMLCIPRDRVTLVITRLIDSGLLTACDDERAFIPNIELFNAYIDYIREQTATDTGFSDPTATVLLCGGNEMVVRHTPLGEEVGEVDLQPVHQDTFVEILGCEKEEDIIHEFDRLFHDMQEPPLPALSTDSAIATGMMPEEKMPQEQDLAEDAESPDTAEPPSPDKPNETP